MQQDIRLPGGRTLRAHAGGDAPDDRTGALLPPLLETTAARGIRPLSGGVLLQPPVEVRQVIGGMAEDA